MGGNNYEQGRFARDRAPLRATVIARWENDRALLRTDDSGDVYSVTVPEGVRPSFDVGVVAWVELDAAGALRDWFLDDPAPTA